MSSSDSGQTKKDFKPSSETGKALEKVFGCWTCQDTGCLICQPPKTEKS